MAGRKPSSRSARGRSGRKNGMKLRRRDKRALAELRRKGQESVRVLKRARILELVAEGWTGEDAAEAVGVAPSTVDYTKARYIQGGLERALWDDPRGKPEEALNGKQKQQIVAMLCGPSPKGSARWTIRLTAAEALDRKIVPKVGRETIRVLMSNHDLKPWREKNVVRGDVDAGVHREDGGCSGPLRKASGP